MDIRTYINILAYCLDKAKKKTGRPYIRMYICIRDLLSWPIYDYTRISPKTGNKTKGWHKINKRYIFDEDLDYFKKEFKRMPGVGNKTMELFDEIVKEVN